MVGCKNGVFGHMLREQPEIFLCGCTLHVVHNAARKAAGEIPAPVETFLVDVFYYFNKSADRQQRFKGTQALYDVEQRKVLKHVCTRWLSIGR